MVSSYNIGGSWNAEAEETMLRSYRMEHKFNNPARCIITLADVDGAMMRKYNVDQQDLVGAVEDDGGVQTDYLTEINDCLLYTSPSPRD